MRFELLRRAFGCVTVAVGLLFIYFLFVLPPRAPAGDVFIAVLLIAGMAAAFLVQGRRWLLNIVNLSDERTGREMPELVEARGRAQASLSTFEQYLLNPRQQAFVLVPWETDSEIVSTWAVVHAREGERFVVSDAFDPFDPLTPRSDRRTVRPDQIEDWLVPVSEAEVRGGFSILATAKIALARGHRLPRREQERLKAFSDRDREPPTAAQGAPSP